MQKSLIEELAENWLFCTKVTRLSLLKQHIFLILTQPSWDGFLLLYSPKSSIRGTMAKINTFQCKIAEYKSLKHHKPVKKRENFHQPIFSPTQDRSFGAVSNVSLRVFFAPSFETQNDKLVSLKGLSYEIDFENVE